MALFGRELQRWQRRVLSDVLHRDLIGGDAGVWLMCRTRLDSAQPRAWRRGMHRRPVRGAIAEAADDGELIAEGLQRLEDRGPFEAGAGGGRRPFVHHGAV